MHIAILLIFSFLLIFLWILGFLTKNRNILIARDIVLGMIFAASAGLSESTSGSTFSLLAASLFAISASLRATSGNK